jgi:hypothetical protein
VCRALGVVRDLRPEVVGHLVAAADELIAAVREFTAPHPPAQGTPGGGWGPSRSGSPVPGSPGGGSPVPGSPGGGAPASADGGTPDSAGGGASWISFAPASPPPVTVQHIEITD